MAEEGKLKTPSRFPLQWPNGWRRTPAARRRDFLPDRPFGYALDRLLNELRRMGVEEHTIIVSSDIPLRLDGMPRADRGEPLDPGIAIYFKYDGRDLSFACDTYSTTRGNVRALALTIEAIRGLERWGTSDMKDRAFRGFAALPEKATSPWKETLGFQKDENITVDRIELRFRELVKKHHPDYGGNEETFRQIVEARSVGRRELQSS